MFLIFSVVVVVVGTAASSALRSSAAIKMEKSCCEITCGLDIGIMCRRNGSVVWLGCRIGGIGSDWKPGPRSRMHVAGSL